MSSDTLTDVLAHFDPQAWINGDAVTIDVPYGEDDTWPLSDEDLAAARKALDAGYDLDFLRDSDTSPIPAWVRAHSGPFTLSIIDPLTGEYLN